MRARTQPRSDRDVLLVSAAAAAVSLFSLLYYFQGGQVLLYGDAVAHLNIARRVFDSQTPGLLQLGTVWLPLPHLLMLPFIMSDWLWRSGLAGSIPSMVAFVFSAAGIYRLTRSILEANQDSRAVARTGAWIATSTFVLNPNLVYVQTTAMTEALYLALFIWAAVFFIDTQGGTAAGEAKFRSSLWKCALCLTGAELTRYDGWFFAAAVGLVFTVRILYRWRDMSFRRTTVKFLIAIAVAPISWLGYNAAVYGDPLEFSRGPYSAKAIEQRTAKPGYPAHPGAGNVAVASAFFLKSAQLNMAPGNWGRIWIAISLGAVALVWRRWASARLVLCLLAVPLIFYALSIAFGGVPLFLPAWWPYTWYNIRYGLQFLPLFAVSAGLVAVGVPIALQGIVAKTPPVRLRAAAGAAVVAIVAAGYLSIWHSEPLCLTEARVNSRTKLSLESSVARLLASLPASAKYLMYVGDHVGVFPQAGIPLRQVINEGNHRPWVRPADPAGLWERALANPPAFVDFVIAYEGDAVDQKVDKANHSLITEIHTTGQPHARIYAARTLNQSR